MSVDWGVVFGLTGVAVGSLSLLYARTQAIHARRQADAANLATTLQLQLRPVFDGCPLADRKVK